jgi:aspartyl/asparaginyl beta-hydroxylase (cupin superfamily)
VYRTYGDALVWSGNPAAASAVFDKGTREGFWPHGPHCRPARARPVIGIPLHTQPARIFFPHVAMKLEAALETIQKEFAAVSDGDVGASDVWVRESAGLHSHGSTGAWYVLLLVVNGQPQQGCALMKQTCNVLMSLPSVRLLRDGQVTCMHCSPLITLLTPRVTSQAKLSRMAPGTRVLPHAGPTNLRLRLQLPIRVHEQDDSRMRVGAQGWRTWTANESFVFDESCEHEVEIGSDARTVLLVDFANPLLMSVQDYTSLAVRVTGGDVVSGSALAATREAAKEWQQAQAHWQLQRGAEEAEL